MKLTPVRLTLTLALLNQISSRAVRVVLALYALELGAQPVTVGLLAAMFSAFPMLLSVTAGRLADRFGSRWLLVIGAMGGGIGILVPYFVPGLPAIFFASAMIGLSTAIYNVSLQNLVGLQSNTKNRAQNFSNYSLTVSVSNFVGPIAAGFSIDHWGYPVTCLCLALFAAAPLALLALRGSELPAAKHAVERAHGSIRDMLAVPGVRRTLVTSSMLHSGGDLFQFYLPVYAHAIGLSASTIGIILAMNSAAAFVVRTVLTRIINWLSEEKVLVCAFLVGAASVSLIPFVTSGTMLAALAFIFGLGMGCGQPIVTMQMFGSAPNGRSGEALGLRMTVNHLTRVVTPVLFGAIGSVLGLASAFWVNALMLAAGSMFSRSRK